MIVEQEFLELVAEDAMAIKQREETDSIPIIDDLRYHILKFALPGMDANNGGIDVEAKLLMISELLTRLGLDA